MKINVIGLGFVGLTTAIGFSKKGHSIIGIEKNLSILNDLKRKKIRIYEPGLKKNLEIALKKKKLFLKKIFH